MEYMLERLEERIVLDAGADPTGPMFDGEWHDLGDDNWFTYNYWSLGYGYWWTGNDDTGFAYGYDHGDMWALEDGTWTLLREGGGSSDLFFNGEWIDLYNGQWFRLVDDTDGYFWSDKAGYDTYFYYEFDTGQWWEDTDGDYTTLGWEALGEPDAPHFFVYDGQWHELPDSYWLLPDRDGNAFWEHDLRPHYLFKYSTDGYGYWYYEGADGDYYFAYGYENGDWWRDLDGDPGTNDWVMFGESGASDDYLYDGLRHTLEDGTEYLFDGSESYWQISAASEFAYTHETGQWWWFDGSEWFSLGDAGQDFVPIFDGAWHDLGTGLQYKYYEGSHFWLSDVTDGFMFDTDIGQWSYDTGDDINNPDWLAFEPYGELTDADAAFLFDGAWHHTGDGRWLKMNDGLTMDWWSGDEGFEAHFRYDFMSEQWEENTSGDWQNPVWELFDAPLKSGDFLYDGQYHDLPNDLQYQHRPDAGYWLHDGTDGPKQYAYEYTTGQWWARSGQNWLTYGDPYQYTSYPHFLFVNDAPVVNAPGTVTADEDSSYVFSSANGSLISISDSDAGYGDLRLTLGVGHGALTLSATNGLTFESGSNGTGNMVLTGTLADINAALDGLTYTPPENYIGTIGILIMVNDQGNTGTGSAGQSSTWAYVDVQAVNDSPVAAPDSYATDEDTFLTVPADGVLGNDTDEETPGDLFVSAYDATSTLGASVTVNADGSFSYDPAGAAALQALQVGETVDDTFTYTVSDPGGATDVETVTIEVSGLNDAPTLEQPFVLEVDEDSADVTINLFDYITDPDDPDNQLYIGTYGSSDPDLADIVDYSPSTFTLTFGEHENGSAVIGFEIIDPLDARIELDLQITVNPVNDDPRLFTTSGFTGFEDDNPVNVSGAVEVYDPDMEYDGDTLTMTIQAVTGFSGFFTDLASPYVEITGSGTGTLELTSSSLLDLNEVLGYLRGDLLPDFFGEASFSVVVEDLDGASDGPEIVTGSIGNTQDPPVITVSPTYAANEDSTVWLGGYISIGDVDPGTDTYTFTVTPTEGFMTFWATGLPGVTVTGNGTANLQISGTNLADLNSVIDTLLGVMVTDFNGTATASLQATDSAPGTTTDTISVEILPVNDAPEQTVTVTLPQVTELGIRHDLGNLVTVSDVDFQWEGDTLTVQITAVDGFRALFAEAVGTAQVTGNGTMTITVQDDNALDINATLATLEGELAADFYGTARLSVSTHDLEGASTGAEESTMNVPNPQMVYDHNPGTAGSIDTAGVEYNGALYYSPEVGPDTGLFRYDGSIVEEVFANTVKGSSLFVWNGQLFFAENTLNGGNLWTYDGSVFTELTSHDVITASIQEIEGRLYYVDVGGTNGQTLYTYDGTTQNVIWWGSNVYHDSLTAMDSSIYFEMDRGDGNGIYLFMCDLDGSDLIWLEYHLVQGTLRTIDGGSRIGNWIFYEINDESHGLWANYYYPNKDEMVKYYIGPEGNLMDTLTWSYYGIYVAAPDANGNNDLYSLGDDVYMLMYDGDVDPSSVIRYNDSMIFSDRDNGDLQWVYGLGELPGMHETVFTGSVIGSSVQEINGWVYFVDSTSGNDLYRYYRYGDYTPTIELVHDGNVDPSSITGIGGNVFFTDATSGVDLYVFDGTSTTMIHDGLVSAGSLIELDGTVYFGDSSSGSDLYAYSGGSSSSLVFDGDVNFFSLYSTSGGLFFTNTAGTTLYRAIGGTTEVVLSSGQYIIYEGFAVAGDSFYFINAPTEYGPEMWRFVTV
jgi:VCBS repeat-containing protein